MSVFFLPGGLTVLTLQQVFPGYHQRKGSGASAAQHNVSALTQRHSSLKCAQTILLFIHIHVAQGSALIMQLLKVQTCTLL